MKFRSLMIRGQRGQKRQKPGANQERKTTHLESERELQAKLNLSCIRARTKDPSDGWAQEGRIRLGPVRVIKSIEELRPKLNTQPFRGRESFEDTDVPVLNPGSKYGCPA